MAHLNAAFWAFPFDADPVPLPQLRKWTISPRDDEAGLVELTYPKAGRNYDRLAAIVDADVDLEVEITVTDADGNAWIDRAILDEADLDDVDETGMGTFRGLMLSRIFDEVVLPYHPTGDQGNTPAAGTAGYVMRVFLQAAQARGALAGVTWTFTDSHDSNGVPWGNPGNLSFSPGQTYRAILGTLRGYQMAEWSLTAGRELRLTNVDGNGVDRTVGANPLTLEHGRDLGDAPRKWRLRGALTDLVSSGKDGIYSSATNATARARRRRRVEGYRSFGNTTDQGTLNALTQARLNTETGGRTEVSHKLALGPGHPTPLLGFRTGDYVFSATRRGVDRRRVRQITLEGDESEVVAASVTMGVLLDEAAVRQQERIDALASGEAVVGTSTAPPETDDGSIPAAPSGMVATSLWYSNNEGAGECSVTATWTGVPDARVEGYIVEWRYLANPLGTVWRRMPQTTDTTLSWSAMAPGQGVAVRVAAVNKWGRLSNWSGAYSFSTETDGTAPPVASTPTPYVSIGLIVVPWDGKGSAGEPMPGDFLRGEVHVSTTSGFTPHRPLVAGGKILDEKASTTYAGELRGATDLVVDTGPAGYGVTFYVKIVLVDRTGNAAAASAQGSVVGKGVQDAEVAEFSVSKLKAGVITALVGIGNKLYAGNPNGAGWEGDAAGFRFFSMINGTRTAVLEFIAATAQLTLTGTVQTGRTGRRAVLSGADNDLKFFPSADETRWGVLESFIPNNYPDSIAVQMTSSRANNLDNAGFVQASPGQANLLVSQPGNAIATFAKVQVLRDSIAIGLSTGLTPGGFRGGQLSCGRYYGVTTHNQAEMSAYSYGTLRSLVGVRDDGIMLLNTDAGTSYMHIKRDGYIIMNGYELMTPSGISSYVKSFVIDHPTDPDRWLVHGCTESPTAGVEYSGEVTVVDGSAVVELPDYFEGLVGEAGRTVQVSVVLDGPDGALCLVAATEVRDGRFTVRTTLRDPVRVAWHVRGTRRDTAFEVEPLRADYDAHGDGPYRYLTRREAA